MAGIRHSDLPNAITVAISAIRREDEATSEVFPMKVTPAAEALFIVNPLHGSGVANLFATHPPLEERIARLRALTV